MMAARTMPEPDAVQITFPPSEETELPSGQHVMELPDFVHHEPKGSSDAVSSVAQN